MKHLIPLVAVSTAISSLGFAGDFQTPISTPSSDTAEPYIHIHRSALGTPYVHSFGIEPAFTGRDLFMDHTYRSGDGFNEHETELELEWAFTKRFGIIAELPYIFEDEAGTPSVSGLGDFAIVPRYLLVESEHFLLTAQVETVLPTGSSRFGGNTAIAPGIAVWNDLGNWFTLNTQLSVEHGFDADETEFVYGFGLVKSFGDDHADHNHSDLHHMHSGGLLNLHLEVTGSTPLNGDDQGDFYAEGLVGISYGLSAALDVRLGYQFPISSPKDFDHGVTTGLVFHF